MRRFARGLAQVVLASTVIALSACGSNSGSTAEKPAEKPESITYWSMWQQDEAQQKVLAQAIAEWEKETGIKVNVEWQGRQVLQSLTPALNTNNVPDLADSPYIRLAPVFAETGSAADLSSVYDLEVDGKKVKDLVGSNNMVEGRTVVEGKPWMLPYSLTSDGVWFDKSQHPELATNPPKTWEEFIKLLDEFKSKGKTPIALDGDIGGYNSAWFATLYIREFGPGSLQKLVADKTGAGWDDPKVLEVAQRVQALVEGGYFIKGYGASKFPAQQTQWASRNAELLLNGSWIPSETATYVASGFEFASFQLPANSGKKYARADYIGFIIPEKAANKYWAGHFAASVLAKKHQDALGTQAKALPIRQDASTVAELSNIVESIRGAEGVYQQLDGIIFPTYNDTVLFPNNTDLVLGKISAKEFVSKMKKDTVAYWENN